MLVLWSMTALALYALRLYGQAPSDVGVRSPHQPLQLLLGFSVVALLALSSIGKGDVGPRYARRIQLLLPVSIIDWLWFIPVAATAGICEEFLYRGYALSELARLTHSLGAGVALSSLAFALAHFYQGRFGMIGAGLSGLGYALVVVATGSVLPCMLGHFAQDMLGAFVLGRRLRVAR